MSSFESHFIERQAITQGLLQNIRLLGEYKGKQELFKEQALQLLKTLLQTSIIQSTESSNRIEGVTALPDRMKGLLEEKTAPRDRSEQEITGYRDVLNTIHVSHANIPFTPNVVLQLHRDLYKFTSERGGAWNKEFEGRVGMLTVARGAKREMVLNAVDLLPRKFQVADVERLSPGVSRPTINRALADLRDEGRINCVKPGRGAIWEKLGA